MTNRNYKVSGKKLLPKAYNLTRNQAKKLGRSLTILDLSCVGEDPMELPCERELDDAGWCCINDHTGCLWNDGHNTCNHEGESLSPLEEQSND